MKIIEEGDMVGLILTREQACYITTLVRWTEVSARDAEDYNCILARNLKASKGLLAEVNLFLFQHLIRARCPRLEELTTNPFPQPT